MDLNQIAPALIYDEATGLWLSSSDHKTSYHEDGSVFGQSIEPGSFWFQHRRLCVADVVKEFPSNHAGPLLDIGGGNGLLAETLAQDGIATAVLEPDLKAASFCKKRRIATVICSTLEGAKFKEGSLPAVGLFDVLSQIEDDQEFLGSIYHMLRPGGCAYITAPAYSWLWSQADVLSGHYRRYNRSSISALSADIGFEVLYSSYFFSWLVFPILLLRALPYRLGYRPRTDLSGHQRAHASSSFLLSKCLQALLRFERRMLKRQSSIPLGSSVFFVLKKPDVTGKK